MTLTLEREPTTEARATGTPAAKRTSTAPRADGPKPARSRRRALRWMLLAALLVAGILTAVIATADGASAPKDVGTVELESVEGTESKTPTPTKPPAEGSGEATTFGPFGTDGETPACTALPWSLLPCPEKSKP